MPNYKLHCGDNLVVLRAMKAASVDAVITDTPYATDRGDWDKIPSRELMSELLRVCKPGAHILAMGLPRTHHKLMTSMEAAGWEIRDMILWMYGSGFTAGAMGLAKQIDALYGEEGTTEGDVYTPSSPEAQEFDGFGIGLKPAWDPIILARKPVIGTLAENLVTHGTGALDIKSSMIESDVDEVVEFRERSGRKRRRLPNASRWPANVALDGEAATFIEGLNPGASRYFYCGKASPSEREAGCHNLELKSTGRTEVLKKNSHPTVKPIALMRWLTRLIAPVGSVVLDPYMGSGSTGCAVGQEGGRFFIGIEAIQEYYDIAEVRIAHWTV